MSSNIVIDGTITKDIEIKTTSYGEVLTLNIASNLGRDETAWYQVSVWGKLAEIMKDKLGAKDRVLITGDLKKVNAYTKRDGTAGAQIDVQANKVRLLLSSADKELLRASKPQDSNQYQRQQAPQQQQAPKGNGTWGQQPPQQQQAPQQQQQQAPQQQQHNSWNGQQDRGQPQGQPLPPAPDGGWGQSGQSQPPQWGQTSQPAPDQGQDPIPF